MRSGSLRTEDGAKSLVASRTSVSEDGPVNSAVVARFPVSLLLPATVAAR